ncbi:GEVED domain-containing protein [Xanthomarina sp. F1114]|uniref:GEVED domain-containing protein n=1 Tax=Xanthomarina sp. F1114 TaxID=2996019 RepID=UPI00225E1F07|nr:GEVED domain-containing protein [Xanthomarina sp. F1114]MCX7548523.1 GEVED domain-containing protein [Xanthomarina sp. F1114]
MKKITMLFFATLVTTLMWFPSHAQTPCSQETLGGAAVENGYGNLHLLIYANDLAVDANTTFTLNTVQFNVLVSPGTPIDGVQFYFYQDSDSGTGPGVELGSTAMQVPTSITNVGSGFGFDLMEVSTDLDTPFTFIGGAAETAYYIGVQIDYTGASSYMEVVSTMNTTNDIYFLENGVWTSGLAGFDEAADGVISFFGDCEAVAGCTGTPDAGTAMVNPSTGNPGSAYTVSAQGITAATDMSFQWQSNTNGAGWVDEGTVQSELLTYNATAPTELGDVVEWRLISTCTNSSESATSSVATFTTVLSYCDVQFPNNVEPITSVVFAGIDNQSDATVGVHPPLEDFTAQSASVELGSSYSIEVQGNTDGSYTAKIVAYIDWNQDGTFDDAPGSEEMYSLTDIVGSTGTDGTVSTGSIAVPAGALLGDTRMRVMKKFSSVPGPCNTSGWGQAEDYTVNVVAATSINDNNMLAGASLYPNPMNNNTFYVRAPKLNGEQLEVNITDMAGRQIFNNKMTVNDNKLTVSLNDALTSGLYLVTLKHSSETSTFRLVKE